MLEAKNVVKTFDGFRALDGVSMTVPQGAVYGLVGPNGAGKSTIIRHFTGIYRPDSGEITLDGQPVYENPAVKGRMAAIPDDWYFFPQASIREMARLYAGTHPFFSWDRYHKLREVFPLSEKQPLRRMSKGMQKQAAFWLTMSCMPEVLVLDEPVDGLDPVMRRQVWSLLLGDVADRGTTVLVSSHNLRESVRLAGQHREDPGSLCRGGGTGPAPGAGGAAPVRRGKGVYLHHPGQAGGHPAPDAGPVAPAAGGHSPDPGGNFHL